MQIALTKHVVLVPLLSGEGVIATACIHEGMYGMLVAGGIFMLLLIALGFADARARFSFAMFSIGTVRDLGAEAMRSLASKSLSEDSSPFRRHCRAINRRYGKGDGGAEDGTDGNFRQTGLQDNNGKFGGVSSFR